MITHKFYTDPFHKNSDIAKYGGVDLHEMNFLEEEFLEVIDFNLIVDTDEYARYIDDLMSVFAKGLTPDAIQILEETNKSKQ